MNSKRAKRLRIQARAEATSGVDDRRRRRPPLKHHAGELLVGRDGALRWSDDSYRAVIRRLKRAQ